MGESALKGTTFILEIWARYLHYNAYFRLVLLDSHLLVVEEEWEEEEWVVTTLFITVKYNLDMVSNLWQP